VRGAEVDQHVHRTAGPCAGVPGDQFDPAGRPAGLGAGPGVRDALLVEVDADTGGGRLGLQDAKQQFGPAAAEVGDPLPGERAERADQPGGVLLGERAVEGQVAVERGDL